MVRSYRHGPGLRDDYSKTFDPRAESHYLMFTFRFLASLLGKHGTNPFGHHAVGQGTVATGIPRYKLDHLRFKVWEQVEAAGVVYAEAAIKKVDRWDIHVAGKYRSIEARGQSPQKIDFSADVGSSISGGSCSSLVSRH